MTLNISDIKILVVEDSSIMNRLICSVLDRLGIINVISTRDGSEGFRAFTLERPDIVIADWMMDNGDGIELVKKIRQDGGSSHKMVPIIMLTGYNTYKRVCVARDAGVTEFMVKPFSVEELAKRIEHVINSPRDFVFSQEYNGPDRRRKVDFNYSGPFRRKSDNQVIDFNESGKYNL